MGLGLLIPLVLLALVGTWALLAPLPERSSTERVCEQPSAVEYEDGGGYAVFVRRSSPVVPLLRSDELRAVVGRGDGSHGVVVALNPSTTDAEEVTCAWGSDAVEIIEPFGIVHTVPAEVFTGGR
jgi:hypothetical protein